MSEEGIDEGIIAAAEADHMAAMELSQICAEQDERIAQLESRIECALALIAGYRAGADAANWHFTSLDKIAEALSPPTTEDECEQI